MISREPGIPPARRRARRLTRWRRAGTAGISVLAVAAVAVLTVGTGPARPAAAPAPAGPAALRHFNPLVPYISFGWLPAGQKLVAGDNAPGAAGPGSGAAQLDGPVRLGPRGLRGRPVPSYRPGRAADLLHPGPGRPHRHDHQARAGGARPPRLLGRPVPDLAVRPRRLGRADAALPGRHPEAGHAGPAQEGTGTRPGGSPRTSGTAPPHRRCCSPSSCGTCPASGGWAACSTCRRATSSGPSGSR